MIMKPKQKFVSNLELTFNPKKEQKFRITMINDYLNSIGRIAKQQTLVSKFSRLIDKNYENKFYLTSNKFDSIHFTGKSVRNKADTESDWSFFAQKFDIKYFISTVAFDPNEDEDYKNIVTYLKTGNQNPNKIDINEVLGELSICVGERINVLYQNVSMLPKLPSVYLMIMQIFDILAFDTYLSYIHSKSELSMVGQEIRINILEDYFFRKIPIHFGLYASNSCFINSNFFIEKVGYAKKSGRSLLIYRYYCNGSKVKVVEKNNRSKREGTSYYDGMIYINKKTGDIEKATMNEYYYAMQYSNIAMNNERKIPANIIRKINLESE